MLWNLKEPLILLIITTLCACQNKQYDQSIQAAKISLFVWQDPTNLYQLSTPYLSKNYTFTFNQSFKASPQVALGLYTLDSEYSVYFSVEYQDVTLTNMTVWIYKLTANRLNQIYIMYFGTDYVNFECVLINYDTSVLGLDNDNSTYQQHELKSQSQVFNFQTQRNISDTYITLYLAGIHLQSETTDAGFKYNYTDLMMEAQPINDDSKEKGMTYSFKLTISTSGRVCIYSLQFFYIAYEQSKVEDGGRFILNSGKVGQDSFGGMVSQSNQSASVPSLYKQYYVTTETFFFGLNDLRSRNGNIRILGVEQVSGSAEEQSFTLIMQTWQYTYVESVAFSFLQVKKIRCDKDPYLPLGLVDCPNACANYFYMADQTCLPCQYSCAVCIDSTTCVSCSPLGTRYLNGTCLCNSGYYDTLQLDCVACPKNCLQCESSIICTSCRQEDFRFLNPITRDCQCQFGYIDTPNQIICKACVVGCSNCSSEATCSSCMYGYFWINNTFCSQICTRSQVYNYGINGCDEFQGDSNNAMGKFDYNWEYGFNGTDLILYVFLTKQDAQFYYYQGGNGYGEDGLEGKGDGSGSSGYNSDSYSFGDGGGTIYFDDGNGFYQGYSSSRGASTIQSLSNSAQSDGGWGTSTTSTITIQNQSAINQTSYSQSDVENGQYDNGNLYSASTHSTIVSADGSTTTTTIRTVSIDGTVTIRTFTIPSNMTSYYYMNTGELNRYQIEGEPENANYIDAFNQNMEFRINGDLIPIKVQGISSSSFVITAKPTESYIDGRGILSIKDQGLVVYNKVVGIQDNPEPNTISRYDLYSEQQITQSYHQYESNRIIVQTVWTICRILLFLWMGWSVMPVMLTMQYIFTHAYISSKLPLNLDYFLRSFKDYRNPSLFFMSTRDAIDRSIFPAVNSVYKVVPEYNIYDRGIDFLYNDFQFILTCLLSFALLALVYGLAVLVLASSDYAISPIMNYFWRRKLLHLGSYCLVTTLPISFFFFGQMYDASHYGPNSHYSTFNIFVAMLTFLGLLVVPAVLIYFLYSKFNYQKILKANQDIQMMMMLKEAVENTPSHYAMLQYNQPLWSVDESSKLGCLWVSLMYYKLMLFAWATSFFSANGSYQIISMVIINAVFFLFTLFSGFFTSQLYKFYFLVQLGGMIAYELLVASLSSDHELSTDGLLNMGYLGIGILYMLWISAFLLSSWRLWSTLQHLFTNYMARGKFLLFRPRTVEDLNILQPQRERALTGRKSTILEGKRMTTRLGSQFKRSNMVPGSQMLFKLPQNQDQVIERSNNGEYSSLSLGLKSNAIMNKFTRKENLAFPEAINTNAGLRTSDINVNVGQMAVNAIHMGQNNNPAYQITNINSNVGNIPYPYPPINNYDHSPTNLLRDVGRQQLDMGNFQPHSQMQIHTDQIIMKAVAPLEPFQQAEPAFGHTNLDHYPQTIIQSNKIITTRKTITSHTHIVENQRSQILGNNIPSNLMQLACQQPYILESSTLGPNGRTVFFRQLHPQHNIILILHQVLEPLWQRLSTKGINIQLSPTGQLLLNGQPHQANIEVQQRPQEHNDRLTLWRVNGNTVILKFVTSGELIVLDNIDKFAVARLTNPNNTITTRNKKIYLNGTYIYDVVQPKNLPINHFRLVFGSVDGSDVLLYNVTNGRVVRVEDMNDDDVLQQLRNPNNFITSDGQSVYINGVDICDEEDTQNSIEQQPPLTNRIDIRQELNQEKSAIAPTSSGSSKINNGQPASQHNRNIPLFFGKDDIEESQPSKQITPVKVMSTIRARFEIAAIPPAYFSLSQSAMDNAEWISDEISSYEQISPIMQFLMNNFPGCKYLLHNIGTGRFVEATHSSFSDLRKQFG